ncbi:MAG: methanogenesis marker 3 protein [Candidatus Methanomethylophilaceae archaeon]
MKVIVNGKEKILKASATLKDAIQGEHYVKDTLMSVHLSTEKLIKETDDFEIVTSLGSIVIHLDDSEDARIWKASIKDIEGMTARWATHNIVAFGSFATKISVNRESRMYKRYDCFFSLGGFDNNTTYIMVVKDDHRWSYGAGTGRIGRITKGRHIIDVFKEGDRIIGIMPVVSEVNTDNVIVTSDLSYKLEENYRVDTHVLIELNDQAPESAEHVLILANKGHMNISDATGSYAACSDDKDVVIPEEPHAVRNRGSVTVRYTGEGLGRVFFYKDRRQMIVSHNDVGRIINGMAIASAAKDGDNLSILTSPSRLLSVGMTQKEGGAFLEFAGVKQKRTGDTSDDAIIAEQTPELTVIALKEKEVRTFGVPKERIFKVVLDRKKAPETVHYFEKVTGLSHKSIGFMKVHFTFEDLPMVTFEGDDIRGQVLYPHNPFKKCKRGDLGVTNQARPYRGLMGIRLTDSKEYGPTGEEGYGTNIFGKFDDDLDKFMKDLKEDDIVYITERRL